VAPPAPAAGCRCQTAHAYPLFHRAPTATVATLASSHGGRTATRSSLPRLRGTWPRREPRHRDLIVTGDSRLAQRRESRPGPSLRIASGSGPGVSRETFPCTETVAGGSGERMGIGRDNFSVPSAGWEGVALSYRFHGPCSLIRRTVADEEKAAIDGRHSSPVSLNLRWRDQRGRHAQGTDARSAGRPTPRDCACFT